MSRIAFLGTPGAAVPTLRALAGSHDVVVVITQPDRPRGRSKSPAPSPVKEEAADLGLDVRQPATGDEIRHVLDEAGPLDLGVVVAYGRLLPPEALGVPRNGMLNVHFSLLPRWRGAAPVARALLAGDSMTGVTIIRLDHGLDTGPVLTAQAVDVQSEETSGELTIRLAGLGARLLTEVIPPYLRGEMEPVTQTDEGMTYAAKIEPGDRPLQPQSPAREAVNRVRALSPEPGATLAIDGETIQILRARLAGSSPGIGIWASQSDQPIAGFVDGGVELVELKPPGKAAMSGEAWLRGRNRAAGKIG
ncbi:MAG TPA: methionyl-tRNA formyltransferase [Acidimicrobiia bacterium]|nr:methionyl-tRNA formyltransferase [Acidimicrobiia bacterium]